MKTPVLAMLAALGCVLALLALPAMAAEEAAPRVAPPGQSKGEIKAQREFRMLDFNGDGKLSRGEVQLFPRLEAAFDRADADGDGFVSFGEVRAFAIIYRAERDRQRSAPAVEPPAASAR